MGGGEVKQILLFALLLRQATTEHAGDSGSERWMPVVIKQQLQ